MIDEEQSNETTTIYDGDGAVFCIAPAVSVTCAKCGHKDKRQHNAGWRDGDWVEIWDCGSCGGLTVHPATTHLHIAEAGWLSEHSDRRAYVVLVNGRRFDTVWSHDTDRALALAAVTARRYAQALSRHNHRARYEGEWCGEYARYSKETPGDVKRILFDESLAVALP